MTWKNKKYHNKTSQCKEITEWQEVHMNLVTTWLFPSQLF